MTKSKEHIISASILQKMSPDGKTVIVSGAPWMPEGPSGQPIAGLQSGILCKRHNETLGLLDDAASEFFSFLQTAIEPQANAKDRHMLFDGGALELWLIKVMAGMYYSNYAAKGDVAVRSISSFSGARYLSGERSARVSFPTGLQLKHGFFNDEMTSNTLRFFPYLSADEARLIGCEIQLHGLRFALLCDPKNGDPGGLTKQDIYHPGHVEIASPFGYSTFVHLSWPVGQTAHRGGCYILGTQPRKL